MHENFRPTLKIVRKNLRSRAYKTQLVQELKSNDRRLRRTFAHLKLAIVSVFLFPKINQLNIVDIWFQQGRATGHTARLTIDLLQNQFGDKFVSRWSWSLASSFMLFNAPWLFWGYVKSLIYADKSTILEALEFNIQITIDAIRPDLLEKVIKNWTNQVYQRTQKSYSKNKCH